MFERAIATLDGWVLVYVVSPILKRFIRLLGKYGIRFNPFIGAMLCVFIGWATATILSIGSSSILVISFVLGFASFCYLWSFSHSESATVVGQGYERDGVSHGIRRRFLLFWICGNIFFAWLTHNHLSWEMVWMYLPLELNITCVLLAHYIVLCAPNQRQRPGH